MVVVVHGSPTAKFAEIARQQPLMRQLRWMVVGGLVRSRHTVEARLSANRAQVDAVEDHSES